MTFFFCFSISRGGGGGGRPLGHAPGYYTCTSIFIFNCFITHGYLPREFMKTAIVPIIKNKSGNTSDISNYRPITLVTACSKIFESCLLKMLETIWKLMIISLDLTVNTLQTCVYLR